MTRMPELKARLARWLADPEPAVRQAAAILLADFPELLSAEVVDRLATDTAAPVRAGIAQAVGFGQLDAQLDVLDKLLLDPQSEVQAAAALSLLSFPTAKSRSILEKHLKQSDYRSLFVNALARQDPSPHLAALCEVIEKELCPENWWGGRIPWGESWDILFKFVQAKPAAELQKGTYDNVLAALESPNYYSSSEPRDLYALYVQRGLKERAASFRAACNKKATFDMEYYFNMVDENPNQYQRN